MNHLSLFSGVGGGDLAHQHMLGWQTVGYVEFDKFCQQVLAQRIEDGFLEEPPIFGDIDDFIESGCAKKYQGYVDVVTAGFPCQPFSVAGKQAGEDDPRNKWPQTIQCIRDLGPRLRYALLENVPGLLSSGYFDEILSDLAEAGMDARWIVLGADDCFAPHRRKRLWILAYPNGGRWKSQPLSGTERTRGKNHCGSNKPSEDGGSRDVADSRHAEPSGRVQAAEGQQSGAGWETWSEPASRRMDVADSNAGHGDQPNQTLCTGGTAADDGSQYVADSDNTGQPSSPWRRQSNWEQARDDTRRSGSEVADSSRLGMEGSGADREQESPTSPGSEISGRDSAGSRATHWPPEPDVGRVVDGVAHRVDRLKAIGNGQVSRVAATAWLLLTQ